MDYKLLLKIVGATIFIIVIILIFSLVELYSQLGRYQRYWDKRNKQSGQVTYVALGDSTAQGIGAGSANKGYVGLIAKQVGGRTVNLSKSGGKIHDVLNTQLPAMQKLSINDKTVITMEIGANDMISFTPQTFESEMDQLMSQLPKQTIISDIPYFGQSRFKSHEPQVEQANEIMYRLAAKHGFTLVPLHQKMQENGGFKTFAADWFHPSDTAYRENWAPVFLDRIR